MKTTMKYQLYKLRNELMFKIYPYLIVSSDKDLIEELGKLMDFIDKVLDTCIIIPKETLYKKIKIETKKYSYTEEISAVLLKKEFTACRTDDKLYSQDPKGWEESAIRHLKYYITDWLQTESEDQEDE